jgi:hypothetical protein
MAGGVEAAKADPPVVEVLAMVGGAGAAHQIPIASRFGVGFRPSSG